MKFTKRILSIIFAMLLLLSFTVNVFAAPSSTSAAGSEQGAFESYTYWQEFGTDSKTPVLCKPMYKVDRVINGVSIGSTPFESVSDIFADKEGNVYLLDGTKSEIFVFDKTYTFIRKISEIKDGDESLRFEGAEGVFVKDGKLYIADTKNARVIVSDLEGNLIKNLLLPESRLIPDGFDYKPIRVCVDSSNTVYVASDGSFYGALVYSADEEFMGFYGANTVAASATDVIKTIFNRLFSNDTKKGSSVLALPYQINDLVIGPDDFVYTATAGQSGNATGQVHVLNPGGKDILGKETFNFADFDVTNYDGKMQYQGIESIDVDDDGFFYILDYRYGKVYWYDKECNLMSVFGGTLGVGEQEGTFSNANAIAVNGTDVIVADDGKKSITVFSITDYGALVRAAQVKTLDDDYEGAEAEWKQVIAQDANSQLGYSGLARAAYVKGDSKKALEYAKLGNDREIYADAFANQRSDILAKLFIPGVLILIVLIIGLILFSRYKKKKGIVLIKNKEILLLKKSVFHPFDAFGTLKEKKMGSVVIATVLLALFYIISAISDIASGFAYNSFDASTYNSFFVLLRTIGLVALWVISNWLVCVLLGGIGKLKEIYVVTCYSLVPLLFSQILSIVLSNILVPDEFVFVTIFSTICVIYTFFVLAVGIMKIHDYSFGKFLATTVLSILSMLIIVFLIFIIFMLAQQVYGWVLTVASELTYG